MDHRTSTALIAGGLALALVGPVGPVGAAQRTGGAAPTLNTVVLRAGVVTAGGGEVREAPSRTGAGGPAMRFPGFDPAATGARAAVLARAGGGADVLDPGTADFSFGATVLLDPVSEQPGSADNGNNVLQRGLFDSRTQYKIQIDDGLVSCRIKGVDGSVTVKAAGTVTPGRWYGLACSRSAGTVTLAVTRWNAEGQPRTELATRDGATGSLRPVSPSVPLAVGAKVHDSGSLTDTCDQFNGVIDDPYVRIGDSVVGIALPGQPTPPTTPPNPAPAKIATTVHGRVHHPRAPRGSEVRVTGTVSPGGATAGARVRLKIVKSRPDGSRVVRWRATDRLSGTGRFRFAEVPVRRGTYRVVFPRQGVLLGSVDVFARHGGRFRHR